MDDLPLFSQKKNRYRNPYINNIKRRPYHYFLWKIGYYKDSIEQIPQEPFEFLLNIQPATKEKPYVMWINHSTFLVQVEDTVILTDPIWTECCSPVFFIGPKRRHEPGLAFENLKRVDVVLISHNHYDHMDKKTILRLHKRFPNILWIVPKGLKDWFLKRKIKKIRELEWYETTRSLTTQGKEMTISSVPSQHFSGRGIFDLNKTLWTGYVLNIQTENYGNKRFYFSGDTGYNPYDFKKIGSLWEGIELSLIPIGAYHPRPFMSGVHINPDEAVAIHRDVGSKLSIGMHWKTFRLSDEPLDRPPYDLFLAMKRANLDPNTFIVLDPGRYVNW